MQVPRNGTIVSMPSSKHRLHKTSTNSKACFLARPGLLSTGTQNTTKVAISSSKFVLICNLRWSQNQLTSSALAGNLWELDSPISQEDRRKMSQTEREIEEYMYHAKEHFNSVAIILRRAVMATKPQWENCVLNQNRWCDAPEITVHFTRSSEVEDGDGTVTVCREDLLEDHAKLCKAALIKKRGFARFEPARALNDVAQGSARWQKKGDCWPIFEKGDRLEERLAKWQNHSQRDGERLKLSRPIQKFAEQFAAQILKTPPLCSFEEVQKFCMDRGLIPRPDVGDSCNSSRSRCARTPKRPNETSGSSRTAKVLRSLDFGSENSGDAEQ